MLTLLIINLFSLHLPPFMLLILHQIGKVWMHVIKNSGNVNETFQYVFMTVIYNT